MSSKGDGRETSELGKSVQPNSEVNARSARQVVREMRQPSRPLCAIWTLLRPGAQPAPKNSGGRGGGPPPAGSTRQARDTAPRSKRALWVLKL